ncbi:MAG: hypothetical protein DCC58_20530 [Chloroflexi bacterium]|nr:MAG: hypothetical protein DCC58_20530 [Chloroflexota bacterium]
MLCVGVGFLLVCYVGLYSVWRIFLFDSSETSAALNNLAFLPLYLAAAIAALLVSRTERLDPRTRRAWLLIAVANLTNWCGDLLWFWYATLQDREPFPSWADAAYLLSYPLLFWGLFTFAARPRSRAETVRFWLDSATVMLAAGMVSWYFVLGPTAVGSDSTLLTRVLSTAYPVGDLVLLFGVVAVLLRGPQPSVVKALRLLLAGIAVTVVADFAFGYLTLSGASANQPWLDVHWMLAPLCIAGAALYQHSAVMRVQHDPTLRLGPQELLAVAPYGGIVVGYTLLLVVGFRSSDYQLAGLLCGAMLMTAIVVSRQIIALHENRLLLRQSSELAAELGQREARFRALVQHASDIVLVLDPDTRIRYVSPSVLRVMGYQPSPLQCSLLLDLVHPEDLERLHAFVGAALAHPGATDPVEIRLRHAEGSWCYIEAIGNNLRDDPAVGGIVVNARDTSDRKRLENELVWQAYHDPLTNLPNRRLFLDRLEGALARSRRSGQEVGLLFVDLDDFKAINDGIGHRGGDDVLTVVAARMRGAVRPGDTVARLAGDEFTVLLEGITVADDAVTVAKRIETAFSAPVEAAGGAVMVTVSIGIALTINGSADLDELLSTADLAMYAAKRQGKARIATAQTDNRPG